MKWLVTAVILVVVAGGAWFLLSGDDDSADTQEITETTEQAEVEGNDEDQTDDAAVETTVINYTDEGFSPSTVGPLPVGTTVSFVNNSSSDNFQPASDPHPVHTDLNGFDSLGPVLIGETYSFTFDEAGEWGFHNHLSSSETGVIVIE